MKVSHSTAVLPPAPPLSLLVPGQVFHFTDNEVTYMLVSMWPHFADMHPRLIVFVDLETGVVYNTGDRRRTVNVLHAEVLVA